MNPPYTFSLNLVWWIATQRAQECGDDVIRPVHFFLALCQFPDVSVEEMERLATTDEQRTELYRHASEVPLSQAQVRVLFSQTWGEAAEIERLRTLERVLQSLTFGNRIPADGVHHRTDASKALFIEAFVLSQPHPIDSVHLLAQLLPHFAERDFPRASSNARAPLR